MKRIIIALVAVAVLAGGGLGAYAYLQHVEELKALEVAKAEEARKAALRAEAAIIVARADALLDDMSGGANQQELRPLLERVEIALGRYPQDAMLHVVMARALIVRDCGAGKAGCSERAKELLLKAVKLNPRQIEAFVLLAHHALNAGCVPCAAPYIESAGRIKADHPAVLSVQGRWAMMVGNLAGAPPPLLRAVNAQPNAKKNAQYYTTLAEAYSGLADLERTEWAYSKSLESQPDGPWRHGNLGVFLICGKGDYERAIPILEKALSMMPYGRARNYLALAKYENWGAAFAQDAKSHATKEAFDGAQALSPDIQGMFLESLSCNGTRQSTRAFLDSGLIGKDMLNFPADNGKTPLASAVQKRDEALVLYMISKGADPNVRSPGGFTPLMLAAGNGDLKLLDLLIARGADVNAARQNGYSVFLFAVGSKGSDEATLQILERLMAAKASLPQPLSLQYHPVLVAVSSSKPATLRWLLAKGYRTDFEKPGGPFDPMFAAIAKGDVPTIQALIDSGYDVNPDALAAERRYDRIAESQGRKDIADLLRRMKRT